MFSKTNRINSYATQTFKKIIDRRESMKERSGETTRK